MARDREQIRHGYKELLTIRRALINAVSDLGETDGRLCDEIAGLGYGQRQAVDRLFPLDTSRRTQIEALLAARVCENCRSWRGCLDYVPSKLPIDEDDPFALQGRSLHDLSAPLFTPKSRARRAEGGSTGYLGKHLR